MKQRMEAPPPGRSGVWRGLALAASLVLLVAGCGGDDSSSGDGRQLTLSGRVQSNGASLTAFKVSLFGSFSGDGGTWVFLGSATTGADGGFTVDYRLTDAQRAQQPVLFIEAASGPAMLASAIGTGDGAVAAPVVVNDFTTVAAGNAFAQFISASGIAGDPTGMRNASQMMTNLADPVSGAVGTALASIPNGDATSTLATFNSLANVVAACVADRGDCAKLFAAATPPAGTVPANVLQALSNIVKYPAYPGYPDTPDPIFQLAQASPAHYPGLAARPTNWLLFLKVTGGFYSDQAPTNLMNGVGNIAFDAHGNAWANDNYEPQYSGQPACAGRRLIEFLPSTQQAPGSPFFGGGLSGAGFGITFDPTGNVWTGNFGFQDPPCTGPLAAQHDSVSAFHPDGTAISPSTGFTQGNISWPQGTSSDRQGNIWLANCGNDSVTRIAGGDPAHAINIPLAALAPGALPKLKPFGTVVDLDGNVWVTTNKGNTVVVIAPDGSIAKTLTNAGSDPGRPFLSHPIGDAADSKGNIWVANSDWLDAPCPDRTNVGPALNPSITLFQRDTREPYPGSPFSGGGLTVPWGITVDGNDTVWVFNFGPDGVGPVPTAAPTGISRFCGTDPGKCPSGMKVGDPISPPTGYISNSLDRITGGQIDRSGNLWVMNNWKQNPNPDLNPGANSIVIVIGAAAPVETPVIGPPVALAPVAPGTVKR
jgi:hypothetical protein